MKPLLLSFAVLAGVAGLAGCGERTSDNAAKAAEARAREQAQAREEAAAALEVQRLAALWTYVDGTVGKDRQFSSAIRSANDVDSDGHGPKSVQLVFRDHQSWGRSSYLVLQAGDFDCYPACTVTVTADDAAPKRMAARRPATDEAIAMFINDAPALWRLTAAAKRLSIQFPVKVGGVRTASFDVAGLDRSKMRGWDAASPGAAQRP